MCGVSVPGTNFFVVGQRPPDKLLARSVTRDAFLSAAGGWCHSSVKPKPNQLPVGSEITERSLPLGKLHYVIYILGCPQAAQCLSYGIRLFGLTRP